ncbi:MAG: glycogen synthase GlgA [Nitrospinota bacterium]
MAIKKLRIAFLSSEVAPFSKTGGLADVAGALPVELKKLGYDIEIFTPLYRSIKNSKIKLSTRSSKVAIPISSRISEGEFIKFKADPITIHFLKSDQYYDRDQLYNDEHGDYPDNLERFVFFSKAVLARLKQMKKRPDIIHLNDWHSSLVPVYLKNRVENDKFFKNTKTLLTIHNLGYQGIFNPKDWHITGLDFTLFHPLYLEFYSMINCLKAGIIFSDMVSTVSPSYAIEIQDKKQGHALEGVLQEKGRNSILTGIVNGIDDTVWNPATDSLIPANFDKNNLEGKKVCKRELLSYFELADSNRALIGIVSRLVTQKGFHLFAKIADKILKKDITLVVLGSGEQWLETFFRELAVAYPTKVGVQIGYNDQLAHLIEAGSDMFLMPSIYEPCGLNQLYSLAYGTVPIARATGGLKDTIENFDLSTNLGNGFLFDEADENELYNAIDRAVTVYNSDRSLWKKIILSGMNANHSLLNSALQYSDLYQKLVKG